MNQQETERHMALLKKLAVIYQLAEDAETEDESREILVKAENIREELAKLQRSGHN